MANSANQLFKDDEREKQTGRPSDDELRHITGIGKSDEAGMESRAQGEKNPASLADQEANPSGGFFRKEGSDSGTAGGKELSGAESGINPPGSGLFKKEETKGRRIGNWSLNRRKSIAGISIAVVLGGGGFFGFATLSGPAMLIQASHVLQKAFSKNNSDSSNRQGHLLRYARAIRKGDLNETRVTRLGSSIFENTLQQLEDIGIKFERNPLTGRPTTTQIDTKNEKLRQQFPETENMTPDELKSFYQQQLGLTTDERLSIDNSGRITIDQTGMDMKPARALTKSTLGLLDDGDIASAIKFRYLSIMFNEPSLLHPLNRKIADLENKTADKFKTQAGKKAEQQQQEDLTSSAEETPGVGELSGAQTEEEVKSKASGVGTKVLIAMTIQAGACFARDISKDIPALDRGKVVLPAIAQASSRIAVGEQNENGGSDVTLEQDGAIADSMFDSNGNSIFGGQAFEALESNGTTGNGPDLSPDYKQAFQGHKTADTVAAWATAAAGGSWAGFTCNSIVMASEALIFAAISLAGAAGSGGSLTPAIVALWTAKVGVSTAASMVFMHWLQNFILNSTTAKTLAQNAFSGPLGGDLLAYGARAAGNVSGIASGGISLANNALTFVDAQQQEREQQQFRSESFASRLFDINDYRTPTGRLAQSVSPNMSQDTSNVASSIMNIGSSLMHVFSSLLPRVSAAPKPYDWGFPQYGLPSFLLDAPQLSDPYDNARQIVPLLQNDTDGVIERAYGCFGAKISNDNSDHVWDVTTTGNVDPESYDYQTHNCNPFVHNSVNDDLNWARTIMFVFDTKTMKAVACYQGDEQSCADLGAGGSNSSNPTPTSPGTYKNPLRGIKNIVPERIDGGVDYNGDNGPIYAIGNGKVQLVETAPASGWPGSPGSYIMYVLSDGPAQGKHVYMAEDCTPTVKVGDTVSTDTVICNYSYQGTAMEMGWSDGTNNYATDDYRSHGGGYYASNTGQNFSDLLKSLGAPPGKIEGTKSTVPMPAGWPTW